MRKGGRIQVGRDSPLFDPAQKMKATIELNHYERELLYGYPYLIGRLNGTAIRAPLFTIPVRIDTEGGGFVVSPDDEIARFNTLPFRSDNNSEARDRALERLTEETPAYPFDTSDLTRFVTSLRREIGDLDVDAALDGRLSTPPSPPNAGSFLRIIDQAAIFVAPTTSYFLTSDLARIGECEDESIADLALGPLLYGAGDGPQAEFDEKAEDSAVIYYPFPSNRSQRRVALLVDHPDTKVIHLEGPPGTGKSLTIANLACHLAATGRTVLITSQKDQALRVVDDQLRQLDLPQLPMTLLSRDSTSRQDLRGRLERIRKERSAAEVQQEVDRRKSDLESSKSAYSELQAEFERALSAEAEYLDAESAVRDSAGLRRLINSWRFSRKRRSLRHRSPRASDSVGLEATEMRTRFLQNGLDFLRSSLDLRTSAAQRIERQQIREFEAVLKRDQARARNFSLFDRLKAQPERAKMLLSLLPVWIMRPDDVARLFPCEPGLFDVVIVDEASQVDLPSITPILFRGKKSIISGDTKQMQPRRFAFTQQAVATEAWQTAGMASVDPEGWLDPVRSSLLSLGAIRAEESAFLNEHYRSLPPIIAFSNNRWYGDTLRIMTDESQKKFGSTEQPIIQLHHVENGEVSNGSQENLAEAQELLSLLKAMLVSPEYAAASIGVLCLFEEQVDLLQDMIATEVEPEAWEKHDLVVVNPDGFQGDERDVILYSLSYDAKVMTRSAIAARQANQEHIQGMLNVAFTRSRDEVHVFHTAPIEAFGFASGEHGAITDWLFHCAAAEKQPRRHRRQVRERLAHADSVFEIEVADELISLGFEVTHNYPSCGFYIDLVVEAGNTRLAVECDGEIYHMDAQGELKAEDLERQAVLERAGWKVQRIPYRRWREHPEEQIQRILDYFAPGEPEQKDADFEDEESVERAGKNRKTFYLPREEAAVLEAMKDGLISEEEVLRRCRDLLGYKALGSRIRASILEAISRLSSRGLIQVEDGELFLTPAGRTLDDITPGPSLRSYRRPTRRGRSSWHRRRW